MTEGPLRIEDRGATRWIVFDRPKRLNAFDSGCVAAIDAAIREAGDDPAVRSIVLTGAGTRAFTAGADIGEIRDFGSAEILRYNRGWLDLFRRIETCRKPVIAAVRGWAMGGGTELTLCCDFVLASDTAVFGLAEIDIGVIPGAGAGVRLTRWLGRLRAKEILMLGRRIPADEAVALHLATRVVPDATLEAETEALAAELNRRAPLALGAAKMTVNIGAEASQDVAMEYELQEFARLFGTADQREGMAAFLEKRRPNYGGT